MKLDPIVALGIINWAYGKLALGNLNLADMHDCLMMDEMKLIIQGAYDNEATPVNSNS